MKEILFLSVALLFTGFLQAQDVLGTQSSIDSVKNIDGLVEIVADSRIDSLLLIHAEMGQQKQGIKGYRVQIFFDSGNNSKRGAMDAREAFLERYPTVAAYLTFKEPYYKVRVGDFRSRIEAEGFLRKIQREWPNAFSVEDLIQFPEL